MESERSSIIQRVMILGRDAEVCRELPELLNVIAAPLSISQVVSADALFAELQANQFDLLILDEGCSEGTTTALLRELKLFEHEPAVILITTSGDLRTVIEAYDEGCHKCVVRDGGWLQEAGAAVRNLLRMKRLERENARLLSRLTETNYLLEEQNKRLSDFAATLAHDIRGPLGGIIMKLEFIVERFARELNPKCSELMQRAVRSSERLMGVVQAMYDFTKLGSKAAVMSEVALDVLVKEVVADLHLDQSADVTITVDPLPPIWGNVALLRRVFVNLINNALKYNDRSPRCVHVGIRGRFFGTIAEFAEISVSDNGRGIAAQELSSVFSMFVRGSNVTDDAGSGLGLSIARRILEMHFGNIRVESTVGTGSTFILSLPVEPVDFGSLPPRSPLEHNVLEAQSPLSLVG